VKRGQEDYDSFIHFVIIQFLGKALQNRYIGTVCETGEKNSFYFKDSDGQQKLKIKIIYEVCLV
jgi:hypothetical protein